MSPNTVVLSKGTPTNFELVIPRLPSMELLKDSEDLILHVYGSVIPSMTLNSIQRHWMGVKADEQPGTGIEYGDWSVDFTVDSEFKNWRILEQWLKYISSGKILSSDHLKPTEHQIKASLMLYDNFRNGLLKVDFHNAWIYSLGDIRISNREGISQLESNATFKYSRYEVITVS